VDFEIFGRSYRAYSTESEPREFILKLAGYVKSKMKAVLDRTHNVTTLDAATREDFTVRAALDIAEEYFLCFSRSSVYLCRSLAEGVRVTICHRDDNVACGINVALSFSYLDNGTPFRELESHVEFWFVSELTRATDVSPAAAPGDPSQTLPERPRHPRSQMN